MILLVYVRPDSQTTKLAEKSSMNVIYKLLVCFVSNVGLLYINTGNMHKKDITHFLLYKKVFETSFNIQHIQCFLFEPCDRKTNKEYTNTVKVNQGFTAVHPNIGTNGLRTVHDTTVSSICSKLYVWLSRPRAEGFIPNLIGGSVQGSIVPR